MRQDLITRIDSDRGAGILLPFEVYGTEGAVTGARGKANHYQPINVLLSHLNRRH